MRRGGKPTLAILVSISMLQPLALNLLAPATPALTRLFSTSYATIQLTLTLFLVAVAVAQVVVGPLSDRYGRRPCVIGGTALFGAGSVMGALAPSVEVLLLARALEGAGSGTTFALSRAIIRDTADRDESAGLIASVTMVMVVAPMFAPWLGGQIVTALGWRAVFWFLTAAGALVLLATVLRLPETAAETGRRSSILGLFAAFPTLARDRDFVLNVVAVTTTSAAFFSFLAAAPFIVVEVMGRSPDVYGNFFILTAGGYMLGNFTMSRLVRRLGAPRMIRAGLAISLVGLAIAAGFSFSPWWHPASLFLPLMLNGFGNGMTLPGATAEALSARPDLAGSAAGLMGAVQLGASAAVAVLVSGAVTLWPPTLPVTMLALTAIGLAAVLRARRRADGA